MCDHNRDVSLQRFAACNCRAYMDRLVPLVRSRKYDLTAIITHRLPLCAEAYSLFDDKRDGCIKVVFDPWAEV